MISKDVMRAMKQRARVTADKYVSGLTADTRLRDARRNAKRIADRYIEDPNAAPVIVGIDPGGVDWTYNLLEYPLHTPDRMTYWEYMARKMSIEPLSSAAVMESLRTGVKIVHPDWQEQAKRFLGVDLSLSGNDPLITHIEIVNKEIT